MKRFIKYIFTLSFLFSFPSFAQSQFIDDKFLEGMLMQNPSIQGSLQQKNIDTQINKEIISQSQTVVNSEDFLKRDQKNSEKENLPDIKSRLPNARSLLKRYFRLLTGENLDIYGSNEFNQPQDDSLLFFNTIGKEYKLAPGDVIQITITGLDSSNKSYQIANDGTLTLENIYPMNVENLSLDQVAKLILNKIRFDDASADVLVRLKTARLITVQVSGNVNYPRSIAIPAYSNLSRVISYAGGISDNGSLRNIYLSQSGKKIQKVDFYNLLQNPSINNDPVIKNGARVFIPNKGSVIAASGFVSRPGIYELDHDKSQMKIEHFLELTGTNFIPPGAILKVLFIDKNGNSSSRFASKNDFINEGEALKVEFIETREINISKIKGAVVNDYDFLSDQPTSIKKVLRDGAVLTLDAFTSFALIIGKTVKAININEALNNEDIVLPVGADLRVFTKEEYLSLVSEDPNDSKNPLVSKIKKAKVAEIYLNGKRIAYVPLYSDRKFYDSIIDFYTPSPETVYNLALVENQSDVDAFDLKTALKHQNRESLNDGDRLLIFENKFFNDLIKDEITLAEDTGDLKNVSADELVVKQYNKNEEQEYIDAINYSRTILSQANVLNVKVNNDLFYILPFEDGINSKAVLNILNGRLPRVMKNFVFIQNKRLITGSSVIKVNEEFKIEKDEEINFFTQESYNELINNYYLADDMNLKQFVDESNAVKVFYNGKLKYLLAPNYSPIQYNILKNITQSENFYKLYIALSYENHENKSWEIKSFEAEQFFNESNETTIKASNEINLFSESFIREKFIKVEDETTFSNAQKNANTQENENINKLTNSQNISITDRADYNLEILDHTDSFTASNLHAAMLSSIRTIHGAVLFPGSYPVADEVLLRDFIETAGLIKEKSNNKVIITEAKNIENKLKKVDPRTVSLDDPIFSKIKLSGVYYTNVPESINEAILGFVELSGEFLMPGMYTITRSETLENVIKRAGGLTNTAYPMGAILQREAIKIEETQTNNILASQLEAAVLSLAQSDIEGVGEQINAVLGYAQQLRNQPTTGRMTTNVLNKKQSEMIYLQDGDKLTIPKRPSHVSIVGAVQRTTVASFKSIYNFKDYIVSAGGLTKMADIRKSYVLLPNGESRVLDNNTIIPPGSVIVVPPKIDKLSVLGLTDIISRVLGNIATSILAINNIN